MNTSATTSAAQVMNFMHHQAASLQAQDIAARVEMQPGDNDTLTSISLVWTPDGPARAPVAGEPSREYTFCVAIAKQLPVTCYFVGHGIATSQTRMSTIGPLAPALEQWFAVFRAESRSHLQTHFGLTFMDTSEDTLHQMVANSRNRLQQTVQQRRAELELMAA